LSSYFAWDNTGTRFQAKAIVTNGIFDQAKYSAYSPVFLSTTLILAYGIAFASFPSVFVHTFCSFVNFFLTLSRLLSLSSVVPKGYHAPIQAYTQR
jgi:hypothetical protein